MSIADKITAQKEDGEEATSVRTETTIVGAHFYVHTSYITIGSVYRQTHLSSTIKSLNYSIDNLDVNRTRLACTEFDRFSNALYQFT